MKPCQNCFPNKDINFGSQKVLGPIVTVAKLSVCCLLISFLLILITIIFITQTHIAITNRTKRLIKLKNCQTD